MGLVNYTIWFGLLLIATEVYCDEFPITLNKIYSGSIQNGLANSYNFTREAGQTVRVRTFIPDKDLQLPLLISIEQRRSILSWTLPLNLTKFSQFSYHQVSRTLCSDYTNTSAVITIWVLTSSIQPIGYSLEVTAVSQFHLIPNTKMNSTSVSFSGGSPYYIKISFPDNSPSDVMKISLNSNDTSCVIASLQPAECPIDDLLSTVEYRGVYLTLKKTADFIFTKENDVINSTKQTVSRYLVLVSAPNERCNTSASLNYYRLEETGFSKKVDITVTLQMATWDYWSPVVILLVLILLPFFILISLFIIETVLIFKSKLLERHYPLIFYTPELENILPPVDDRLENNLLVQQDFTASTRGVDGMTRKEMKTTYNLEIITLHDLTRKEDKYLLKKYCLYLSSVLIVTMFYSLPALQVAIFRAILYNAGDNDLCYFNFKCAHPLDGAVSFNNIWSNIAYLVLGLIFVVLTAIKHIIRNDKYPREQEEKYRDYRKRGITPYYGFYYAMGFALMSEGLMSSIYHTCPSGINFQFDTTFMFIIALLSILKLHQNRHPDVSVSASTAFLLLGSLIILTAFGLLAHDNEFIIVRTFYALIVIGITIFLCLNIYFFSHPQLFFTSVFETIRARSLSVCARSIKNVFWPTVNRPRIVQIGIICSINTISLVGLYYYKLDAATALLMFIIFNLLAYIAYYWVMKLYYGELSHRPIVWLFSFLMSITSGFFFTIALVFFFSSVTNWQLPPSESRNLNKDCAFLDFYDNHDIWHVLSAFGLFFNFLSITMIDDNISDKPKDSDSDSEQELESNQTPVGEHLIKFLYVSLGDVEGGWDSDIFLESRDIKDEYSCTICTGIYRDPIMTRCGHLFCTTCFEKHKGRKITTNCPLDRKVLNATDYFADRFVKKLVEKLRVHCPLEKDSCPWSGQLCNVIEHVKICDYRLVLCRDCKMRIKRNELAMHENSHLKERCSLLSQQLIRVNLHSKSESINPSLIPLGAWAIVNKSLINRGNYITPFYWVVKNVIGQIESSKEIFSPPFLSSINGYQFCVRLNMSGHGNGSGTHLSLYLYIMKGPYDDQIVWPTKHGTFKATLMSQSVEGEDTPYYTKTASIGSHPAFRRKLDIVKKNTSAGWPMYIDFFDLMNERFYVEDSVVIMLDILFPQDSIFPSTIL
ncbi:SID1 transmembrane family member 1-like [Oopsacas minuta]|uniref:SID1 transmembrane family member 1-like n=1 Tax=Oopsacas minuta TaxID=111878 RepID=A0AAV7JSB9_9METZ|nr:SID1 transmembrane family member 1-like [Oopsacas minuta]